jgi:hypothetical protein
METVAVSSAAYGLVLSLVICIVAVGVFTGHLGLLAITVTTMLGSTRLDLLPYIICSIDGFTYETSDSLFFLIRCCTLLLTKLTE